MFCFTFKLLFFLFKNNSERKKQRSQIYQICTNLLVKVPPPSDLRVTNFSDSDMTVRWEAAADDDVSYLTKWRRPETGGEELLDCWSTYYEVKKIQYLNKLLSCVLRSMRYHCLHSMEMELRVKLWPYATAPVSHTFSDPERLSNSGGESLKPFT